MKAHIPAILLLFIIPHYLVAQLHKRNDGFAVVRVTDNWAHRGDTLFLRYYTNTLDNSPAGKDYKELQAAMDSNNAFRFKFPVNDASGCFFIGRKIRSDSIPPDNPTIRFYKISDMYEPDPGDDVLMRITEYVKYYHQYRLDFSGRGIAKYQIKEALKTIGEEIETTAAFNDRYEYMPGNSTEKQIKAKLDFLHEHKPQLTDLQYDVLKAEIIYGDMSVVGWVDYYYNRRAVNVDTEYTRQAHEKFRTEYNKYLESMPDYGLPAAALLKSRSYIRYVLQKTAKCDFAVNHIDKQTLYAFLRKHYSGEIRDQLLTTYFLHPDLTNAVDMKYIKDAIATVTTPYCLLKLKQMDNGLASGIAYNFSLPDITGKSIRMSDFNGKVVLLDFWYTGCGMCVHYYTDHLSAIEEHFKNNPNVVFLSVCIDPDKSSWQKSIQGGNYTSEHAINVFTSGLGAGHPIIDYYKVAGYPTVFLIGKNGRIVNHDQSILREKTTLLNEIEKASK